MLDIFIFDTRDPARNTTYTASKAYLVRTDDGPQLVMRDGLTQTLNTQTGRLLTAGFEDFAYDVGGLIDTSAPTRRSVNGVLTSDLLRPTPQLIAATNSTADQLLFEAHDRFAQSALGFVAGLVGFAALVAGGFSRFGLWRNIGFAVFLVVVLKLLESTGSSIARDDIRRLWPFMHLAGIGGIVITFVLLHISARPYFFKRRPKPPMQEAAT